MVDLLMVEASSYIDVYFVFYNHRHISATKLRFWAIAAPMAFVRCAWRGEFTVLTSTPGLASWESKAPPPNAKFTPNK